MRTAAIFVVEFQQEKRALTRAFTTAKAAVAWARERVANDDTIAATAVWKLTASTSAIEALAIATEGKPWYEDRVCTGVFTRAGVRVSR